MIKVYRYNTEQNTVSHILQGKNGLTMRYNFERGNIITKRKPEIILKNEYAQRLLESSNLFQQGVVTLIRSEKTDEDFAKEKAEEEEKKKAEEANSFIIPSVTTDAELIAFVNEAAERTERNAFHATSTALKWATTNGYSFPNYNPN